MNQYDTFDRASPQAGKVAPEAVALRAQPRPVTRLNRRTLAMLMGGLSVAVLGATIWSLQPHRRGANEQTQLYNVDRVSKSEGLDALPTDYSKLPPNVPELGSPLPGDLGPAIVKSQQYVTPTYAPPGHDPEDAMRKEADAPAASTVFFRSGPARRPDRNAEPARPERGVPERRLYGNPQFRQPANACLAVSGDGRNGDRRGAGDRHQVGLAGRRDRHGD
ncbi:hypothetical protein H4CHR_04234 [Variovorax sp. PBS-H4]|nr:hypothetical protein H4CHR_04234 [Variovorax sp. PBS-H4]